MKSLTKLASRIRSRYVAAFALMTALSYTASATTEDFHVLVRWPSAQVEWCYDGGDAPENLANPDLVIRSLRRAMQLWEDGTALRFHRIPESVPCQSSTGNPVLVVSWAALPEPVQAQGGVTLNSDVQASILSDGIAPALAGGVVISSSLGATLNAQTSKTEAENWERQFVGILVHELGHALGLRHSLDPDSIMWPVVSSRYTPSESDLKLMATLYGTSRAPSRSRQEQSSGRTDISVELVDHQENAIIALSPASTEWVFAHIFFPEGTKNLGFTLTDELGRERARQLKEVPIAGQACSNGRCEVYIPLEQEQSMAALSPGDKLNIIVDDMVAESLPTAGSSQKLDLLPNVIVSVSSPQPVVDELMTLRAAFSASGAPIHARWQIPGFGSVDFDVPPEGGTFDMKVSFRAPAAVDAWLVVDRVTPGAGIVRGVDYGVDDLRRLHIEVISAVLGRGA